MKVLIMSCYCQSDQISMCKAGNHASSYTCLVASVEQALHPCPLCPSQKHDKKCREQKHLWIEGMEQNRTEQKSLYEKRWGLYCGYLRSCGICILGDTFWPLKTWLGKALKSLNSVLSLIWAGGWTRDILWLLPTQMLLWDSDCYTRTDP